MSKLYINRHISIKDGSVIINGNTDFTSEEPEYGKFFKSVYKHYQIKYSKFYKMDGLSKLGFLASELLLKDDAPYEPEETAIILANESSSLNTDIKYQKTIDDAPSPSVFVYTLPNIVIGEICIRNGIRGETAFFIQDKFDTDFICTYVNNIFTSTGTRRCITGWLEVTGDGKYFTHIFLVSDKEPGTEFNVNNLKNIYNE
jgi:hypothetical protein